MKSHTHFSSYISKKKGVHSSGSIISLKIQNPHDTFPKLAIEINKFLPTDIHLVCITQFQKNFNCYFACVDRTYNYILPTHSLISAPYNTNMITETTKALAKESIDFTAETPNNVNKHSNLPRVSIEQLHEMAKILSEFEGTHYFHNFTRSSKTEKDKNADYYQRFIKSMRLDDVFTFKGAEFVQIEIKGQSFIYNQIRKMIGFFISKFRALGKRDENFHQNCVEICQNSDENNEKSTEKDGNSTKNSKDNNNLAKNIKNLAENCEIFKKDNKVQIPCAPSLGLFLKETSFYDRKKRKVVDFGQKDEIYAFIEKRIIPEICENELSKNCFEEWLTENQENM